MISDHGAILSDNFFQVSHITSTSAMFPIGAGQRDFQSPINSLFRLLLSSDDVFDFQQPSSQKSISQKAGIP